MATLEDSQESLSTQQKILCAAGQVFAEKGFRNATVREICKNADVNVASVNYYFRDKERLYIESVKFARQTRANEYPLPDWDDQTGPKQRLQDFVRTMIHRIHGIQQPAWQVQLLVREILFPTNACRELVEQYFKPVFHRLLMIISEIVDQPLPPHKLHKLGLSIIGQIMYYRFTADGIGMLIDQEELDQEFQNDQIAEHIADFCLAALGAMSANATNAKNKTQNEQN